MSDFPENIWYEQMMDLLYECVHCPAIGPACKDCAVERNIDLLERPEGAADE